MSLPTDATTRKATPIARGVLDYFPDAVAAVAAVSRQGNEQHNPGEPLHWAREKSTDHADCIARHLIDRGKIDIDGQRHSAKLAWRALALLQTEIESLHGSRNVRTYPHDPVLGPVPASACADDANSQSARISGDGLGSVQQRQRDAVRQREIDVNHRLLARYGVTY
jgi:hypothetical protein